MTKLRFAAVSFALLAGAASALRIATAQEATGVCALDAAAPIEIAAVDDDLELASMDGRRLALAGVEFPSGAAARETARRFLAERVGAGRLVFLAATSTAPDRWGGVPAGVFVEGEGNAAPLVSLAEELIGAGLARFRPDPAAFACRNGLLATEAQARRRKLGLWASGEYHIVDAGRPETLSGQKGMVLVEGVVGTIGEAGGSLYLNFGPRRGDFAVVIWKRNLETFARAGTSPRMLTGRRVRVRGLIDTAFGPRMELVSPAQIELLGDEFLDGARRP
ncbi:thermonuclease family protein [Methylosinus sp. H3A]|uniref:thermonuclease family protein n=1 Tax=Methylosinus sp. H3A TaxID=2785786 RepID=UPI0018C2DEA8|nr:thermonuclease family protein [Methylosinus sp. H3A]MBG0811270.1 thermonuclease family protein [Methylosinus sp. H3A]